MSTEKIQFTSLLLIFLIASYHFSQSFAAGCKYQGYCKTDDDCIKICVGHEIDPSFMICILSDPKKNKCCCLTHIYKNTQFKLA
ncbi:hypothetical protein BRARA_K00628 [Brassica rapa]|uniref:Knottin scorpion toxin-like domain-containing protein n=1 Tax=Brassica campestris TaxID=3711 RepID=A0A397KZK9_BRACM|nr:hypothetical protein BRARA_K00628 [Brassica rapa]